MSITAITFFHMGKISSKDVKMMEKMMEKSFLYVFLNFFHHLSNVFRASFLCLFQFWHVPSALRSLALAQPPTICKHGALRLT